MINTSRSRAKVEGWQGRRRTYICTECGTKFRVDTLGALPIENRVCNHCQQNTTLYTFINKRTGREKKVRASSAELATLRAWQISPNLTIKSFIAPIYWSKFG